MTCSPSSVWEEDYVSVSFSKIPRCYKTMDKLWIMVGILRLFGLFLNILLCFCEKQLFGLVTRIFHMYSCAILEKISKSQTLYLWHLQSCTVVGLFEPSLNLVLLNISICLTCSIPVVSMSFKSEWKTRLILNRWFHQKPAYLEKYSIFFKKRINASSTGQSLIVMYSKKCSILEHERLGF